MISRAKLTRTLAALTVLAVIAGCSKSATNGSEQGAGTSTTVKQAVTQHKCTPPALKTPVAVASIGADGRDFDVTSFDGTKIRTHWFPNPDATADNPVPTVLMGPGWSLAGATDVDQSAVLGSIDIRSLLDAGFNVLTWDPRGFGESGGYATVDSADNEGRDVQVLIDWVSTLPGVALDSERDPRFGMVGGSYGGGIQLVVAAIDCRVDAIVPIVAWHSLRTSLFKNDTVKIGWAGVLAGAAVTAKVDAHVTNAWDSSRRSGTLSKEDIRWFAERGPGDLVKSIKVPTLFIHGTIDTLFTLDEAVTNYRILTKNKVPTAMLWNCDGHGICLTDKGDVNRARTAAINWLDRYVARDESVELGPGFDVIDQNGKRFVAERYNFDNFEFVSAAGEGSLALVTEGGSGPVDPASAAGQMLAGIAADLTPAKADNAVEVKLSFDEEGHGPVLLLGEPALTFSYKGELAPDSGPSDTANAAAGDGTIVQRPTRVFAQLIDDSTGLVIGNQVTPIKVVLDGKTHQVSVPLELISFSLQPEKSISLQIVASTVAYATPQLGGKIRFSDVKLKVPVGSWLTAAD